METSKYNIRNIEEGDEPEIVQLFNKRYADYSGFTLKTPESWHWRCLQRPDVEREGLLAATDRHNKIVGYAVIGKSGSIWELCYDSEREGQEIVSLLLSESLHYLKKVGATSVSLNAPAEDNAVRCVCKRLSFSMIPPPKMFLSIYDFSVFLSALIERRKHKLMTRFEETLLVKLADAPSWIEDTLIIKIDRNGVQVCNEIQSPTIMLITDVVTFSSLLLSIESPVRSLIRSKLKIRPFRKIPTLLKILLSLRIEANWFYPLSDFG
jgi:hypothetical protein